MKPITRRSFLEKSGTGIAVAGTIPALSIPVPQRGSSPDASAPTSQIQLKVNGQAHRIEVEDRWTLTEVLRDHLGLTGTRLGCDRGECGACTVLLEGKNVYSCSYLAVWADGKDITTVEGLARGDELDPLQQAFITHDGPQCGFCTSGQLMSARALLNDNPHPTEKEARQAMAGNVCRCSNYNRYLEAVLAAAEEDTSRG
ncbi:MAG: (2Fe-2S)-binding protein [Acidobacteriota bacterium]